MLKDYSNKEYFAKKVVYASCYIHMGNRKVTQPTDDWCYYFYYQLGHKLFNEAKGDNALYTIMSEVCQQLWKSAAGESNECNIMCENINKLEFLRMKEVFDYSIEHAFISLKLGESGNSKSCTEALSKCLKKTLSAYKAIGAKCTAGKNGCNCSGLGTVYSLQFCQVLCMFLHRNFHTLEDCSMGTLN
ncbi:KIR-like CYIR protein [Plasmodium cynomolgi strain B]|uniref:KIR-like CYIR protein n=1 Tax=Plasmodium cynomolgi (strain B) TaxID=1120755 RepID=K6VET4_PLACD|nr:KIR-like CYIR protein [Plasmodium cynomolgi strain B]GAB67777.1 KIR-like CYIR protein [Plasmodium cynomolgi strain B]